jgi:hypothetical protein
MGWPVSSFAVLENRITLGTRRETEVVAALGGKVWEMAEKARVKTL